MTCVLSVTVPSETGGAAESISARIMTGPGDAGDVSLMETTGPSASPPHVYQKQRIAPNFVLPIAAGP